MKSKWQALAVVACVAALTGCGGDDGNPSGPSNPGGSGSGSGAMTATLDGQAWTGIVVQAVNQSGVIGIGASSSGAADAIGIGFVDAGPGTYMIGVGSATGATVASGMEVWTASSNLGSGTITVTTLDATRVAGTFAFTAEAAPGSSPATRQVTNGVFDVGF